MATSDGATSRSGDDQVLAGALTEMASEGTYNASATFDTPAQPAASQSAGDVSAGTPAALPASGDDGSVQSSPTAGAAPTVTDPSAAPVAAADPLAGTEPFTYRVNGEAKTLPGVYRVPGEGLMVPEEHAASIEALAERAEVLDRVSREYADQNATLERLTTWNRPTADGKTETLTGRSGLEAMHVDYVSQQAELAIYREMLDPKNLLGPYGLLSKDPDGNIVLDPAALDNWNTKLENAQIKATQAIRQQMATLTGPQAAASTPSGTPSYAASAPTLIKQAAGANESALTADDRALLTKQIDRYIRPVTAEDRRWNPSLKLGAPIVDAEYSTLVQHMVAQRQAAKQTAKVAETAGKHNAGMDKGRQPAKAPVKAATPPAAPPKDERKKADWDTPFRDAMSELAIPIR